MTIIHWNEKTMDAVSNTINLLATSGTRPN